MKENTVTIRGTSGEPCKSLAQVPATSHPMKTINMYEENS